MVKDVFTAEFERRLDAFYLAYDEYKLGKCSAYYLLPLLFKITSYCWCKSPIKYASSL